MELASDHYGGAAGKEGSRFLHVDLSRGWGPMKVIQWTSGATPTGVSGAPTLATAAKGKTIIEAASDNLAEFVREFRNLQKAARVDHRAIRPTTPTYPEST
jgi:creatinine amidohydrolase/Fe(II)-dependent formamide hydrolase-like protein